MAIGRPKQGPLISRERTFAAALAIIDAEGLASLSINRLGKALGVRGGSLYHHFKNKEVILVGACRLALSNVRTPKTSDLAWQDWIVGNAVEYWKALRSHPNLIPLLMRRHRLRIGLEEHNASAGLLAVQGVPPQALLPMLECLEALALGCAACEWARISDDKPDGWQREHPLLFLAMQQADPLGARDFEEVARAAVAAILAGCRERGSTTDGRDGRQAERRDGVSLTGG